MSSHSSGCVEITPIAEVSSSFVDLEWLVQEISLATSKHVLPSGDRGAFIPELNRKIRSISQLTSQQLASLTDQQRFQILSYMAKDLNPLRGRLDHRHGQCQPMEEESSLTDPPTTRPLGANQEATSKVRNMPAETSRPAEPSRSCWIKARANRGHTHGKRAKEES